MWEMSGMLERDQKQPLDHRSPEAGGIFRSPDLVSTLLTLCFGRVHKSYAPAISSQHVGDHLGKTFWKSLLIFTAAYLTQHRQTAVRQRAMQTKIIYV